MTIDVQLDDLLPGSYTVTEVTADNPEGMSLVGENGIEIEVEANNTANVPTAEFTNNRVELGSLKIKKNVTVNGQATTGTSADGTYSFTVAGPNGYSTTQSITITDGVSSELQLDEDRKSVV